MSQADLERFVSDLKTNETLRAELAGNASGIGSVVEFAEGKGYDISAEEARNYIQSQSSTDLNDDQLDAIAGGKGHHHSSTTSVTQVATAQTAVAATTEAIAAETTVNVGAEVEVVAVAAVVLT